MEDLNTRFYSFFDVLVHNKLVKDKADFANKCNISVSILTEIAKGRSKVGVKVIQSSVSEFGLNANWLLTGEGEMLLAPTNEQAQVHEVSQDITAEEPIRKYSTKNEHSYPLVEFKAVAGFGSGDFAIGDRDVKEWYVIPKFRHKKIDFMIEVEGSSMYPKYNSGDVVACKIIQPDRFIQWNKTHVISTKDQGIIIKRIKPGSSDRTLTMVSDNQQYDPFEVNIEEITGLALVIGVIRLE